MGPGIAGAWKGKLAGAGLFAAATAASRYTTQLKIDENTRG